MAKSIKPPMLRQYRELEARYPDALLLFRLGDFYELFDKDAQIAAPELEIVLTTRRFSKEIRLPMCGVPYRRVTAYVGRLIEGGLQELYGLDIANLTPVQALVVLNRLQGLTRAARHLNEQAQHDFGSIPTPTTDRDLP